jgi:hypothetical protein
MSQSILDLTPAVEAVTEPSYPTWNAMRQIVEAPGYPYLQHYKVDFEKYDREILQAQWASGSRFLWVVRTMGTHLSRLGVHPKLNEMLEAALNSESAKAVYLVEGTSVKEITESKARDLLKQFDYRVENGVVHRGRGTDSGIASFTVTLHPWRGDERPHGEVTLVGKPADTLTIGDLVALAQIAGAEVVRESQSLLMPVKAVWYNDEDLYEVIACRRKEMAHVIG